MNMKSKLAAAGSIVLVCFLGATVARVWAMQAREARAASLTTEADCRANKGLWTNGGHIPREGEQLFCVLPAADAGKRCRSSSECESRLCEPDNASYAAHDQGITGACSPFMYGGCITTVENGVVQPTICVD